jgi:hypothetical protein
MMAECASAFPPYGVIRQLSPRCRTFGVVDEGFVAFGRHRLGVVDGTLDGLLPQTSRGNS